MTGASRRRWSREIDEPTARWRQATEDLARDTYVRHVYDVDPADVRLSHLTIDSTRLPVECCVSAIAAAAASLAQIAAG